MTLLGRGIQLASVLALLAPSTGHAFDRYSSFIPHGDAYGRCILCHTSGDGGNGCFTPPCLNVFGVDFRASGIVWNDALAALDSDGDGYINAMEVLDDSRGYPGPSADVSNPGIPDDMNECVLGWDTCDAHATCANLTSGGYGSYVCSCDAGYIGDGHTCVTDCPPGYARSGAGTCDDIDECAGGLDDCGALATCVNSAGSFDCTCPAGFMPASHDCVEINPCDTSPPVCMAHQSCANVGGSAVCLCDVGYVGDASGCTPRCGDGVVVAGEECDDGTENSDTSPNACRTTCVRAHCGDGVVDDGELCDSGAGSCTSCPAPDGGTPSMPDAGSPRVDSGPASMPPASGGGCRAAPGGAAWMPLVLLALALVRLRRRSRY